MQASNRAVNAALYLAMAIGFLAYTSAARANFDVGTTIYGDPRATNPNGIQATVSGDVIGNSVDITVDLSPMAATHPGALLDEFYFNLVAPASDYALTIIDPASWLVSTDVSVVGAGQGSSATFLFEASGVNADRPDINNPLVFNIEKLSGDFIQTDFTDGLTFNSNDVLLGGGNIGAHFQSLNIAGCAGCDDSGFALGDWAASGDPRVNADAPGMIALLSMGLLGLFIERKRR